MTASVAWKIGLSALFFSFGLRSYEEYKESKK
jgi:hypothetical protein